MVWAQDVVCEAWVCVRWRARTHTSSESFQLPLYVGKNTLSVLSHTDPCCLWSVLSYTLKEYVTSSVSGSKRAEWQSQPFKYLTCGEVARPRGKAKSFSSVKHLHYRRARQKDRDKEDEINRRRLQKSFLLWESFSISSICYIKLFSWTVQSNYKQIKSLVCCSSII